MRAAVIAFKNIFNELYGNLDENSRNDEATVGCAHLRHCLNIFA